MAVSARNLDDRKEHHLLPYNKIAGQTTNK